MPSQTVASYADRLQYAVVDQQGKYQTHAFGASAEALHDALATQYESVLAVSHWQTRARGEDQPAQHVVYPEVQQYLFDAHSKTKGTPTLCVARLRKLAT